MRYRVTRIALIVALVVGGLGLVNGLQAQQVVADSAVSTGVGEDLEVLSRGPIHEAFAEPVVFNPEPGVSVRKKPPELVEELPPDQKPEGENVVWISGYWGWDDDIDDFIWVSGFWRAVPPGRQWVPGYWAEADGGFHWVSGFWAAVEAGKVDYLPTPPASLEAGPSIPAPSTDYFWAPGTWQWYENRYVWLSGCWTIANPNWIWVPSHYVWTPRGCIWVNGYWDYALGRRGLLYAPVRFHRPIFAQNDYYYSPRFVVDLTFVTSHFFVRPSCRHYYYGDYHADRYLHSGVYPWFAYHSRRHCYDPIYVHHRHHHGRDWDDRLRADYRDRHDHEHARPPRSFDAHGRTHDHSLVKSIDQVASRRDSDIRLEKITQSRRDDLTKTARETRQLGHQRGELEGRQARGRKDSDKQDPSADKSLPLPKSRNDRPNNTKDDLTKSKSPDAPQASRPRFQPVPKADTASPAKNDRQLDPRVSKTPDPTETKLPKTRDSNHERSSKFDKVKSRAESTPNKDHGENAKVDDSPAGSSQPENRDRSSREPSSTPKIVPNTERQEKPKLELGPESPASPGGRADRINKERKSPSQPSPKLESPEKPRQDAGNTPTGGITIERQNNSNREKNSSPPKIPSTSGRDQQRLEVNKPSDGGSSSGRQNSIKREPTFTPGMIPGSSRQNKAPQDVRSAPANVPQVEHQNRSSRETKPPPAMIPSNSRQENSNPGVRTAPPVTPHVERQERSNREVRSAPAATPSPAREVPPRQETRSSPAATIRSERSGSPRPEIRSTPSPRPEVRSTPSPRPEVRSTPSPRPEVRSTPSPRPEVRSTPSPRPEVRSTPSPRPDSNRGSGGRERNEKKR